MRHLRGFQSRRVRHPSASKSNCVARTVGAIGVRENPPLSQRPFWGCNSNSPRYSARLLPSAKRAAPPPAVTARKLVGRRLTSSEAHMTLAFGPAPCHKVRSSNRSEEHTSELQSRVDLVCRLLL